MNDTANASVDDAGSMDSDYGSSPRIGVNNPSSTPMGAPDWTSELTEVLALCRQHAGNLVRTQPKTALLAAAALGFVAAGLLRRRG